MRNGGQPEEPVEVKLCGKQGRWVIRDLVARLWLCWAKVEMGITGQSRVPRSRALFARAGLEDVCHFGSSLFFGFRVPVRRSSRYRFLCI